MDNGIVGRVFPGAKHIARAGTDCHVAGGRTGRSALCGGHVIIAVMIVQFGRFKAHTLGYPFVGILPSVIYVLCLSGSGQTIVRERSHLSAVGVEIAFAFGRNHQSGVDAANLQVYRLCPRAADVLCRGNPVGVVRGEIYIIGIVHLLQFGRPSRASPFVHNATDGFPVKKVARVPDEESRLAVERRVGHVIVVPILDHSGVGIVSGQQDRLGRSGKELRRATEQQKQECTFCLHKIICV